MKIIQSFWTGNKNSLTDSYGWLLPIFNYLSWIISCNQLRRYYDDVTLVTDSQGYDVLINKLHLPYTDVIVSLDCLNHYNPNLWALAKIKAYQSIKEPFIHVDGDVFIWTKIDESLKNHDLIVQNEETTTDYYGKMWRDIRHAISYMPEEMKQYDLHIDNKAYNMGIFGGTDIDFIQRYTYKAFDFVDKNIKMVNKLQGTNFNIFFEQVLLYEMVLSEGKTTGCFIHENIGDNQYHDFANFDEVPDKRKYLHLLGFYKKQLQVCKKMESFVIRYYPEYYQRLERLFALPEIFTASDYEYTTECTSLLEQDYMRKLVLGKVQLPKNTSVLMREVTSLGKSWELQQLLSTNTIFYIMRTTDFHLEDDRIIVKGLRNSELSFPALRIDKIIFEAVGRACERKVFEIKALTYLDESFPDSEKQNYIKVLWKRIFLLVDIGVMLPVTKQEYDRILLKQ